MKPRIAVGEIPLELADGTFEIGRDEFPRIRRLGSGSASTSSRIGCESANPDPEYVETALDALGEACQQLDVPEASIVFVDTVVPPPAFGLRYGFKGVVHD